VDFIGKSGDAIGERVCELEKKKARAKDVKTCCWRTEIAPTQP
jgi:hypothetical protein